MKKFIKVKKYNVEVIMGLNALKEAGFSTEDIKKLLNQKDCPSQLKILKNVDFDDIKEVDEVMINTDKIVAFGTPTDIFSKTIGEKNKKTVPIYFSSDYSSAWICDEDCYNDLINLE